VPSVHPSVHYSRNNLGMVGLPSARSLEEPVVDSEEAMIMEQ
jgi:hypothetical protein